MILCLDEESGQMGHSQSDKSYRTAKGCRYGCEKTGDSQQQMARVLDVEAQTFGILLAQKKGIQGFDE